MVAADANNVITQMVRNKVNAVGRMAIFSIQKRVMKTKKKKKKKERKRKKEKEGKKKRDKIKLLR